MVAEPPSWVRWRWSGCSPQIESRRALRYQMRLAHRSVAGPCTMLELQHAEPTANSMKALLCLKEKQLGFVSHYVDLLRFEQPWPELVTIHRNGQLPVQVHDGAIFTESTAINEQLEDVFSAMPLRPSDPVERVRMRSWSKSVDEYFLAPSLAGGAGISWCATSPKASARTNSTSCWPGSRSRSSATNGQPSSADRSTRSGLPFPPGLPATAGPLPTSTATRRSPACRACSRVPWAPRVRRARGPGSSA